MEKNDKIEEFIDDEKEKKKSIIYIILICLIIFLLSFMSIVTFASYKTKIGGELSLSIAKPIFSISSVSDKNQSIVNETKNTVYGFKVSNYEGSKINEVKQSYNLEITSKKDVNSINQIDYELYKVDNLEELNKILVSSDPTSLISSLGKEKIILTDNKTNNNFILQASNSQDDYYVLLIKSENVSRDVNDTLKIILDSKQVDINK